MIVQFNKILKRERGVVKRAPSGTRNEAHRAIAASRYTWVGRGRVRARILFSHPPSIDGTSRGHPRCPLFHRQVPCAAQHLQAIRRHHPPARADTLGREARRLHLRARLPLPRASRTTSDAACTLHPPPQEPEVAMAQSEEEAAAAGPTTFEFGYARVVGSEPGDGPVSQE